MSESLIGNFVRPDALDFRDWLFRPTLIEVPQRESAPGLAGGWPSVPG